ncbi:MAG: phage tail tape measure protein, partial [Caulobacteraceae bacterium]|nr:phage tail tape measure protein [Caulobacteraceae bacterium]
MSAGAIRAGRAFVEIFAADSAFQQSMTRIRTSMATMGQQLRRAGTGSFFAGAALGAPLMLAVRSAANFENALFDARASAGLTAAEVDKIRVKSLELSKAGLGGPAAIAQAFTALVKAGMPLEEAMGGAAEAVIKFAANAGVDVTTAAETASDAMNVFGVSSTQATDILKAAADSSSTSVQAMVQAFSQSSAVAGMANQSMQTLAASLAIMANNGVKGSDAGTSVKTMLLRLTAPSDEAATKLREVGLSADSFRGADGKMLPLANVLDILNASLAGLTEGQRDQALLKIFGTDA